MMALIALRDLALVQQVGQELLPYRQLHIVDGKLDGKHWFLAILEEAQEIVSSVRECEPSE